MTYDRCSHNPHTAKAVQAELQNIANDNGKHKQSKNVRRRRFCLGTAVQPVTKML